MFGRESAYHLGILDAQKDWEEKFINMDSQELSDIVNSIDAESEKEVKRSIKTNKAIAGGFVSLIAANYIGSRIFDYDPSIVNMAVMITFPLQLMQGNHMLRKIAYSKEKSRLAKKEYYVRSISGSLWPIIADNRIIESAKEFS